MRKSFNRGVGSTIGLVSALLVFLMVIGVSYIGHLRHESGIIDRLYNRSQAALSAEGAAEEAFMMFRTEMNVSDTEPYFLFRKPVSELDGFQLPYKIKPLINNKLIAEISGNNQRNNRNFSEVDCSFEQVRLFPGSSEDSLEKVGVLVITAVAVIRNVPFKCEYKREFKVTRVQPPQSLVGLNSDRISYYYSDSGFLSRIENIRGQTAVRSTAGQEHLSRIMGEGYLLCLESGRGWHQSASRDVETDRFIVTLAEPLLSYRELPFEERERQ